MAKQKRKLTAAEKAEKKRRRKEYMTVFMNGKQKRVKRPPTIEGMDVEEFIRQNADPSALIQKVIRLHLGSFSHISAHAALAINHWR